MADSRVFNLGSTDVRTVVAELESFLRNEKKMEVQSAPTQDGFIIQAGQEKDTLRTLSGMRIATNVQLSVTAYNELNVTIGEGKWTDKLGAGAVGLFLLWPLAVTAGIGAYRQKMLPDEIFDLIGRILGAPGRTAEFSSAPQPSPAAQTFSVTCPNCGAKLAENSKFCNQCGAKLNTACPACGAPMTPGSKFCSQCGQTL